MSATSPITPEHARRFASDGFFVLERVVPPRDLELLRGECRRLVDERDREMDRLGVDRLDLDHRGRRYFVHAYDTSPAVRRFLFSDLMAQVARTALGDTVYLFNEQYVVKAAERGMRFGWHQDSGFIDYPHRAVPHLLDRARRRQRGQRHRVPAPIRPRRHARRRRARPRRGDQRPDRLLRRRPGRPRRRARRQHRLLLEHGLPPQRPQHHRHMRRVYVAQYSAEPILDEDGSRPRHLAVPLPA